VSNLPFLKKKQTGIAGPLTEYRKPDAEGEGHHDKEDNEDEGLIACARDLIECVKAGDERGAAKAWRAGFEILDSEPHFEGKHLNESEGDEE